MFPYLIGIIASIFLTFYLGFIEVFDSDMGLAAGYFGFGGKINFHFNFIFFELMFLALQIYLWICALSLYRELLEAELDCTKPTRTTV